MVSYICIIDFSHLFHVSRAAALNAGPDYELEATTIEQFVGKLRTTKRALNERGITGYDLVFAEDRPALRKLALLPTYREGRQDLTDEKNAVKQYLLQNGSITRFCFSEGNEADDTIASLVSLCIPQETLHTVIVSGDRDLWQLMQPRVTIFNPVTSRKNKEHRDPVITEADVLRAFKVRPIHVPLYKALWGDAGDSVPNVLPRTQKQLLPIIAKTDGSLEAFKARLQMDDKYMLTEKCYENYLKALWCIERNYALVRLDDRCEITWE